ncbi:hypothetical protein CW304_08575 [Bacillus sp. UFRGS-B20]|nr:hypothetical protein CW304_08575 [Bacillus sp. UFRGS-B20]
MKSLLNGNTIGKGNQSFVRVDVATGIRVSECVIYNLRDIDLLWDQFLVMGKEKNKGIFRL